MSDDFFIRLERQLEAAELRQLKRAPALRRIVNPRRLRSAPLAAAAAIGVVVVALVAIVVTVARESDVERPAAPPGKKVVATDVEHGVRFSLDGRVLTVQLIAPVRNQTFETVSGAEISATCGTNVAAPPGDPRSEITLFRRWPDGQTSLSYRFPRDVSRWCRLDRQSVGIVALVSFPGAWPGARGPIAETAHNWARRVRRHRSGLQRYTVCEDVHQAVQKSLAVGSGAPHRDGPGNRHQRRPSGRHVDERQCAPAATHRDGRVADRRVRRGRAAGGATAEAAGSRPLTD